MENDKDILDYFSKKDLPFKQKILSITQLSGGLTNYVYRIKFHDNSSVVLKHVSKNLAHAKHIELSQKRYFTERNALKYLGNDETLPKNNIKVPKLLYHDDDNYLLIMEDAGEHCMTLLQALSQKELDSKTTIFFAERIHWFINYLSYNSGIRPKTHLDLFKNETAWLINQVYYPELFRSQAKEYQLEAELKLYLDNIDLIAQQPNYDAEDTVFVFGDLWPNSMLFDGKQMILWVIDWEMARFHCPLVDLEQLMGNLWIMKENAKDFNAIQTGNLISELQRNFFGEKEKDWRENCGKLGKIRFVLWILVLIKEKHWGIEEKRETVMKAIKEVENGLFNA